MRPRLQRASAPRRRLFSSLPCVLFAGLLLPPAPGWAADLFTPGDEPPPPSVASADLTVRSRLVSMDLEQVRRAWAAAAPPAQTEHTRDPSGHPDTTGPAPVPGTTLTFNLFADVVVTGIVERTAPTFSGGYSVAGHLVEEPLGTMTLVVNGETVVGTVRLPGETYAIRSVGGGLYAISEEEEPPLDCEAEAPHSGTDHLH